MTIALEKSSTAIHSISLRSGNAMGLALPGDGPPSMVSPQRQMDEERRDNLAMILASVILLAAALYKCYGF